MLVDFECSEILKPTSILQEISPNRKRKNLHVTEGALCSGAKPQILADCHTRFSLGNKFYTSETLIFATVALSHVNFIPHSTRVILDSATVYVS